MISIESSREIAEIGSLRDGAHQKGPGCADARELQRFDGSRQLFRRPVVVEEQQ